CNEKLCESCVRSHKFSRFTKSHKVLSLSGDTSQDATATINLLSQWTLYCKEHVSEPLKYYCKKDECLICQDCFVISHQGHPCDNIEATARNNQKNLNSVIDLGRQRLDKYDAYINEGHIQKQTIEKNLEDSKAKLIEDRRKIHAKVDAFYNALEAEAATMGAASVKNTIAHLADLQFDRDAIGNTITQLENLQKHGNPADVVYMIPDINLKREVWSIPPNLGFSPATPIEVCCSQIDDSMITFGSLNASSSFGNQDDAHHDVNIVSTKLMGHKSMIKKSMGVLQNGDIVTAEVEVMKSDLNDYKEKKPTRIVIYDKTWSVKKILDIKTGVEKTIGGMTVTPDNCIAVTYKMEDRSMVKIFNHKGIQVRELLTPSIECPNTIAMNHLNELVILDCAHGRIHYIDFETGEDKIKQKENESDSDAESCKSDDEEQITSILDDSNIAVNSRNDVIVAEKSCGVNAYNRNGKQLFQFDGTDDNIELENVQDICIDNKDNVIVVGEHNLYLLSPDGCFVKRWKIEHLIGNFDNLQIYTCAALNMKGDLIVDSLEMCNVVRTINYEAKYLDWFNNIFGGKDEDTLWFSDFFNL
ncbi:unnamed protein product, partial [Owenia fusiformis]